MVFVCFGALLFATAPALSQELRDRERAAPQEPSASESTSPNLPEWAKPSEPPVRDQRQRDAGSLSGATTDGSMRTNAPPPGEEPVPVDGGLALLAAAGAGYAARRLTEEEDEDDDPA